MWSTSVDGTHTAGKVFQKFPFLLPHEMIACMYEAYPQEFAKYIHGHAPLRDLWAKFPRNDPRLRGRPVQRHEDFMGTAIPMKLHGDGVPVGQARGRSLDFIPYRRCLRRRDLHGTHI